MKYIHALPDLNIFALTPTPSFLEFSNDLKKLFNKTPKLFKLTSIDENGTTFGIRSRHKIENNKTQVLANNTSHVLLKE